MQAAVVMISLLAICPAAPRKVDQIALARVLLLDGHANRALRALLEVDLTKEGIDLAEYYRLRGLAEHGLNMYTEAVASFQLAMKNGENATATWYAMASAQFASDDARGALETLEKSPPTVWTLPGAHRIEAQARYKLGDKYRAFEAADTGFALFANDADLERLRIVLLLELGLSQEGLQASKKLLERKETSAKDYLAIASAFMSARDTDGAAQLLEIALLRFPEIPEVREQLARIYFEAGRPLSAAQVLHPLAIENPTTALLAAELYARAGRFDQALRFNGLVTDQKKKTRQRLTLLIQNERYHEAAALDARLARLGLLADEKLLYALAYAHYVSGNHRRVESLLGNITQPELFQKATEIRRLMEECAADVWKCE